MSFYFCYCIATCWTRITSCLKKVNSFLFSVNFTSYKIQLEHHCSLSKLNNLLSHVSNGKLNITRLLLEVGMQRPRSTVSCPGSPCSSVVDSGVNPMFLCLVQAASLSLGSHKIELNYKIYF